MYFQQQNELFFALQWTHKMSEFVICVLINITRKMWSVWGQKCPNDTWTQLVPLPPLQMLMVFFCSPQAAGGLRAKLRERGKSPGLASLTADSQPPPQPPVRSHRPLLGLS